MKLKKTTQCAKCPWRRSTDPRTIPGGYCETKHRALAATIAREGDVSALQTGALRVMACHETEDAHCLGWLMHQLGPGNNIPLRFAMRSCENINKVKLIGEQHATFADTLPAKG